MINILANQHDGEYTSGNSYSCRESIHKYITQKTTLNLVEVVFLGKQEGWDTHCAGTDQGHLNWLKRIAIAPENSDQTQQHRENSFDQEHGGCGTDVVHHTASLVHNFRHSGKIGIHEHYICNVLGSITSLCHNHAAVCLFQCQNIVHTVTGHGNCMLLFLKGKHHLFLLLRSYTAEYGTLCNGTLHILRCGDSGGINIFICILQACFFCNGRNSHRIITGDHFQIYALVFEKCQGFRSIIPDNVSKHK